MCSTLRTGWRRGSASYHRKMVERMPWWMPTPVATLMLPYFLPVGRIRGSMRKRARAILGEDLICTGRWPKPDEEEKMREALIKVMQMLDSKFKSDDQEWICATPSPSAADFSLQGVLRETR